MSDERAMKKRANGIASRNAILDAAAQIAGERGYEGTGIKAVSELSGLPPSSIYWHFKNKDELIAAVIDRSFTAWVEALNEPLFTTDEEDQREAFIAGFRESALQLAKFPDFLRLGLMLMLERRPDEPAARQRFGKARTETTERIARSLGLAFPDVGAAEARDLATLTLAASDGLFIAADNGETDLVAGFETLGRAIWGAVNAGQAAREA
jgi:AcrR family transcriptional regulator